MRRFLRHHTRRAAKFGLLLIALLLLPAAQAEGKAITVEEWFLSTHVADSYIGGSVSHGFYTVLNPFQDSHVVALGESMAEAWYDFSWSPQAGVGSFQSGVANQAAGVPASSAFSASNGSISITPMIDLRLDVTASYLYDLPAGPMVASLSVAVADVDAGIGLWGDSPQAHTFPGGSASGTLDVHVADLILPMGHTWTLRYSTTIHTTWDTAGYVGTGFGSIDFQFQPVPEPATAWLLALGALCLLKRTRHRRP